MRARIDEPHFLLAEPRTLRVSCDLARAHVIAEMILHKMLCNSNWLCEFLDRRSAIRFRDNAAVNLAALAALFGSLVAAACGFCNLNSLPRDAMCYSGWNSLPSE